MMDDAIHQYLRRKADLTTRPLLSGALDGVDTVVVIPALAEYDNLFATLDSLACNDPEQLARTLVICVVNNRAPGIARAADIEDNQKTLARLKALIGAGSPLRLAYVDASSPGKELPDKSGVGLARKTGLDHALSSLRGGAYSPRRASSGAPRNDEGILISLDADTLVEPNYLRAIRRHFTTASPWAAVIGYVHRLDASDANVPAILSYELFLRYHELGLAYAGSPYAFPTIGSAMCCTARAYAAVSGMNQRQAGEDFYFLQQLAKTGPVARIDETTVHPSARPSHRVPFGTGRSVADYAGKGDAAYQTYHPDIYRILRDWLAAIADELDSDASRLMTTARAISPQLAAFLANDFPVVWERLQKNAPNAQHLCAQFHRWFDGFKTLKFVHFMRDNGFSPRDLFESIHTLMRWTGRACPAPSATARGDLGYQRALLDAMRHSPRI